MRNPYFFPPFRFGAWVRAEAATLFTAGDDFGSRKSLDAVDATLFDVRSFAGFFVAMVGSFRKVVVWKHDRIRLEQAAHLHLRPAHSVDRSADAFGLDLGHLQFGLRAKPREQHHHSVLARRIERFPRELAGCSQFAAYDFGRARQGLIHFCSLFYSLAGFCRSFWRSAIVDCRYVMSALCATGTAINTYGD